MAFMTFCKRLKWCHWKARANADERSFTLTGQSATLHSHTYAELSKGLIKGYMLIWNPKDAERMERVLTTMQSSFKPIGDRALDPGLVPMPAAAKQGLLVGAGSAPPRPVAHRVLCRCNRHGADHDRGGAKLQPHHA